MTKTEEIIEKKYELATDWLGEPVSDKVNEVTAECLEFDMKKALSDLKQETKAEVIKEIKELIDGDKIYPKDIFPEMTSAKINRIHKFMIRYMDIPIDRLSAHISRQLLNNIKEKISEKFNDGD